jgi:hypothetical protein
VKYKLPVWLLLLPATALAQQLRAPEIAYKPDANFLKLPQGMYLGEAAGVAVNSKDDILVYNRGQKTA